MKAPAGCFRTAARGGNGAYEADAGNLGPIKPLCPQPQVRYVIPLSFRVIAVSLETHMNETDVVIIGAGHNGLTCAAYLAAAGLRVRVVDRRKVVGGAAVTEEFVPGFRNSVAAYTVSLLNPRIVSDLKLGK